MPIKGLLTSMILDLIGDNALLLDQTTYQTVANGLPLFEDGLRIGNASTYFMLDGNDLKLYVNGTLRQTWTTVVAASYLLMEDDGFLLMEDDGKLVLEA